jgi:hypothetical protein
MKYMSFYKKFKFLFERTSQGTWFTTVDLGNTSAMNNDCFTRKTKT